jgi:hypothetical protein
MQDRVELFLLTLGLSGATLIISHHNWRLRWIYFVISLLFGFGMGTVATNTPALEDWDYVVSAGATLMGPAILMWLRGKTLNEVIDELQDMRQNIQDKKEGPPDGK